MSIIGSAWGEETETTVTMSDYTQEEKDSKSITRTSDGVSFSLKNLSKIDGTKGPNAVAGTEFVVSVPENSSIKNVEFNIGGSSSAGSLRFQIYADDEIIESEHQPDLLKNCVMPYPKEGSLENTVRSLKFVVVTTDETKPSNFYITSAKVTYTKTLTPTDNTIDVVDLNYVHNTSVSNILDRNLPDFVLTFEGGNGCKYNTPNLLIRNASGKMTVGLTDDNIAAGVKMTKIVFTGTVTTGLTASVGTIDAANGTWTSAEGVTEVTFASTTSDATDLTFTSMVITTNDTPKNIGNTITPTITLASNALTAEIGTNATVNSPAVTTVPQNFKVRYKIDGDNPTGSTINEETGVVTIGNTPGVITVQAFFSGKRFDGTNNNNNLFRAATPASYTLTITELTQKTTTFNVSDFNYERGAQGIAGVGLNREIGGFTFTFNPNNSQFVKANGYQNFFFRVNESGTLVIAPDANNSGAKITQVVLKGSFSKNKDQDAIEAITGLTASATEGSCETAIDIANGTLAVTCAGTSVVNITTEKLSNAFTVSSIEVTTDRDVTFEKITPTITFDSSEISYAVGSASFVNGVTVTPANFRLAYSITSNGTGSTIKEYTESDGNGVAGTVTIGATAGTETITAAFAGNNNNFYNPAEATYTLKIIAEELSVANEQVVYAVNTDKLYSFVTDGAGKVTYTALEGNVNAATSTAGNAITYTSSDENLIKVNAETGELSLGDNWTAGKAVTITATSAAGQTATYTVKLKFETSIEFGVESVNAHLNVGFVEPKATIVPAGVNHVTYSRNNLNIATVDESTGEVTFPASSTGTVSITATIPDNDYYMGSSDTYQIAVGSAISAGEDALKDYQIVSYQDSKYTANTGHKFTVANATADKKIISGEQFTNVPGIELTFGAYSGLGDVNVGDLHNLGTIWTLGEDKYLAHQTAATYDEETNLPIGGYMAFEPVVSGILTMDLTWYKGQTFVLVDKSTNAIVESYTAGSEYAGEHRFSTPLQAGRTYYLYNKGGKVDGVEVNDVMKFRSASFTPVFLDKVTSIIPSKLTDGKVLFNIMGADYYNGSSVIPSLSTARHDHDDITYKLSDGTYLNMTADGVFEILEAMEGNNNAVTVTITANIEAKTAAPNDDTDGDTDHMHSSVAVCQVTYTKSDIKFAKESIDVTLFAENKGADIVEPALTYTKDDVAYASSNTNAFTVDANTGNLTVGTNPSGETTITATVNNDDILRYYTNNSAQYKIKCMNYSHVKINQTEVEMTVGETGVNILRRGFIEVVHEHLDKIYRQYDETSLYGNAGERKVYKTDVVDLFINNGLESGVNTFFVDATKTITGKNNGSANTNILYVNKVLTMDAKAAGTTTVYVNLEKLAYSENGQDKNPTITTPFDAVTIPIKVTIKPREFTAENATLRVWDFTKEIDAATLQTFANSNSTYWTYNESDNTVKTSVIKPTEDEDAAYYEEYDGDKGKFLEGKHAFESQKFDMSVFNETLEQEGSKDVLRLSTYNQSNYDYYTKKELGRQHNHELNVVSDITLNKKSTIKDNNYMPPVDGSNTNLGESSDVCYRGINLEGKASFLHVPNVDDNISIMMIADHNSTKTDDYLDFASSGSNQAGLIVGPYKMTDGTYAAGYNYNRLTNVINYSPRTDENGIVTEVAVEPAGGQVNVVSVVAGYIATCGILNKGEGKVPTSAETRTDGYTTVVSPYNIDMTGQKVVKAYICDYYGKDNNKVHMKQIKHIPANTPVMLRGYARDLYALFISEGNKAVDPGIDESFIKNNRLRGNATEDIYVPLEETEVNSEGEVVKYYNYGLSGSKWVKFGTDGTMKAGKAYLRLTEKEWADLQEAMISSAGVSATRLSFEFEDLDVSDDNVSTGIVQVGIQKDVAGDGYYYSINGIRIGKEKPASKGVYIYNGKKIVVR